MRETTETTQKPATIRGYYDIIAVLFVAFLLVSNIAATKLIGASIGPIKLVFDGGAILFPLTYILGDVLSEVYGFRRARRVIVTGFLVQILASVVFAIVVALPPNSDYADQEAFAAVVGVVPRFVAASTLGFLCGQLLNSYVLIRIKKRWGEKHLWARLMGSTLVGEAVDTVVFCAVA
ncbi:MAG: queuosine precursor transporter, partial [Ancrocorticia sp.]|nr:queuosine precursor transporter [Ancrocorticia sp.]